MPAGCRWPFEAGRLRLLQEGEQRKFVHEVEHRTFSGAYAAARGRRVLYITERCVFTLTAEGLELVEVAPGIELERDILAQMDFTPVIRGAPRLMDERIFLPETMGLRDLLLSIPLERRFTYDTQNNLFFINFERLSVRSMEDIERIRRLVAERLSPLGRRVYAIVNYDDFSIQPEMLDAYAAMVSDLTERFYSGVTRYTTSAFLRMKLGGALTGRGLAPHVYESAEEARQTLHEMENQAAT